MKGGGVRGPSGRDSGARGLDILTFVNVVQIGLAFPEGLLLHLTILTGGEARLVDGAVVSDRLGDLGVFSSVFHIV